MTLSAGTDLSATTVVVGIGATPNTGWLVDSGLVLDDGVVSDEYCRAEGQSYVWAAAVRTDGERVGTSMRPEHRTNAVEQAVCVAANLTDPGALRPHAPVEYVWSDQYDWRIQIVGRPERASAHRVVGSVDGDPPRYEALFANVAGRLCGAATVNWPKALLMCRPRLAANDFYDEVLSRVEALARGVR